MSGDAHLRLLRFVARRARCEEAKLTRPQQPGLLRLRLAMTSTRSYAITCLVDLAVALLASGAWLAHTAIARDELIAPRATEIVYDRNGVFVTQIGHVDAKDPSRVDYGYWPLATIPERVARATLALEDRRFYDHPGVDAYAILRAAWNNLLGRGKTFGRIDHRHADRANARSGAAQFRKQNR